MIIQGRKEQKQVVIKQKKLKYFQQYAILPWKLGVHSTNKEMK